MTKPCQFCKQSSRKLVDEQKESVDSTERTAVVPASLSFDLSSMRKFLQGRSSRCVQSPCNSQLRQLPGFVERHAATPALGWAAQLSSSKLVWRASDLRLCESWRLTVRTSGSLLGKIAGPNKTRRAAYFSLNRRLPASGLSMRG